jgi:hypothetical protein
MGDSSNWLPTAHRHEERERASRNARFFEKLIMSFMRTSGSSLRQKSGMMGETPAKNPMMAKALNFGFTQAKGRLRPK